MLGAYQTSVDSTLKTGKVLIDKGPIDDVVVIEGKIADLKAHWDTICALSVERLVKSVSNFYQKRKVRVSNVRKQLYPRLAIG